MKTTRIITLVYLLFTFISCRFDFTQNIDDKIPQAYLQADFKHITSNIETQVPNPYYLCAKSSYDSIKRQISASLNKPMTTIEFYRKVAPMFTLLKDEHFGIYLVQNPARKNPDFYFPFTVFIDQDKIVIDSCLRTGTGVKKRG